MSDLREHGSKDDPNYYEYHPDAGPHNIRDKPNFGDTVAADRAWNAPLTPEQDEAVRIYTSEVYANVNGHLRGRYSGGSSLDMEGPGKTVVKRTIAGLDAAMRPSAQPMDLFRGTAFTAFESVLGEGAYKADDVYSALVGSVGAIFEDKAYVSTSMQALVKGYKGREVHLFLRAPAGTPSIMAAEESNYGEEHEVILNRGTKWRLDSVTKRAHGLDVHGTVVP